MGSVSSEPEAPQRAGLIKQPLELELPVVATGARPGDNSEKRELFSEETETVLVFENGCVIQLAAAVNVGQLVFLTNKQSGKEIVTQVLRKKSFRPTDCYVELEFTEPAPDFWGHKFPEAGATVKTNADEGSGAAAVAEAEVTEEDGQQPIPTPDANEVARLRQEVGELKSKQKAQMAPKEEPNQEIAHAPEQPVSPDQMTGMQQPSASELANLKSLLQPKQPVQEESVEEKASAPAAPAAETSKETKEEAIAFPFKMQLPKADESAVRSSEFAADATALAAVEAAEKQLPKPSLDFEQFPGLTQQRTKLFSGKATRSLSGPIGAMVAIVLFLVAAVIGAYRMGWYPKFGGKTSRADSSKSAFPPLDGTSTPGGPTAALSKNSSPAQAEVQQVERGQPQVANTAHNETNGLTAGKNSLEESVASPEATAKPQPELRADSGAVSVKKNTPVKPAGKSLPDAVAPQDDAYVPPKLVKAIKSLSPPEALWKYTSGNVVLDVLVNETGHVESATVISGPKALHQRAITTVKEYLYQPAMKNGKPVPAHVEEKIQFWYEP